MKEPDATFWATVSNPWPFPTIENRLCEHEAYLAKQLNEIRTILTAYETGGLGLGEAVGKMNEVLWSGRVRREMESK